MVHNGCLWLLIVDNYLSDVLCTEDAIFSVLLCCELMLHLPFIAVNYTSNAPNPDVAHSIGFKQNLFEYSVIIISIAFQLCLSKLCIYVDDW